MAVLILTIASILGTYNLAESMLEEYEVQKFFFAKYVDNQVEFRSVIKPLPVGDGTIDVSAASYLIHYYVVNTESYSGNLVSPKSIQERISMIENNASRMVLNKYLDYIDPKKNPDTPLFKYQSQNSRKIEITSIQFPANISRPESAIVAFKATDNIYGDTSVSHWKATISYSLNSIANVVDHHAKLNFFITSYQTEQIS
jgi:type IV secretory pathway component VirB8